VIERVSPLFPSYVFVLITLQWHAVNNAPGIGKLIMDGDHEGHRGLWAGQAAHDRERVLLELLGQKDVPVEVPADDVVPMQ
jgi:hypothetical protein